MLAAAMLSEENQELKNHRRMGARTKSQISITFVNEYWACKCDRFLLAKVKVTT